MSSSGIISKVEELLLPILEEQNLELVDIELKREPVGLVLRLFIDSEDGVDLETCSKVSEEVSRLLDMEALIQKSYTLEVSSPGVDRPLKKPQDYKRFLGSKIHVKTCKPITTNRRQFTGYLKSAGDQAFIIKCQEELIEIPMALVSKAHLVADIGF